MTHPYWPEIDDLLRADGEIQARAVFDVDGVPMVAFLDNDGQLLQSEDRLRAVRQRIWNQNLITVVVVIDGNRAHPFPVVPGVQAGSPLQWDNVDAASPFSRADVQSGDISERLPDWFDPGDRVDRKLLSNLRVLVDRLADDLKTTGMADDAARQRAQLFAGQILFVSYLEHRDIVSTTYQRERQVRPLYDAVRERNGGEVDRLLQRLRGDFNGDFLRDEKGETFSWTTLNPTAFDWMAQFLARTDLESGQTDLWPYNFRYLPVELISGIYESFLGPVQRELGAYYTPRHLANLAVDLAFEGSADVLKETVFDGACGSGILLTTAFRRLLGEAERRRGGELPIAERITLLREHIFGSDVSWSACRVTAFSLYLSLLERLQPPDIAALQNDQNVKLPQLRGINILTGADEGDTFSVDNAHAQSRRFTIALSNPPWREPESGEKNTALQWAVDHGVDLARKQMAGAFAFRLLDALAPNGKLCLILPMSLLLAPTSAGFVNAWLHRVRIDRLINFGDLKELMFDTARYSCVVVRARARTEPHGRIPTPETFEYLVPKADVSLAFGRLAVHGADKHVVQTQAIAANNSELVTRMWGDDVDIALCARLRLRGTFEDLFRSKQWLFRKGIHLKDRHAALVSASPFEGQPFVRPAALYHAPVIAADNLEVFPTLDAIPDFNTEEAALIFGKGPRVLFPDGPSADLEVRAAFTDQPMTFQHSVGVIASRRGEADADLLRFTAAYLRSDLVRYFLVMRVFQVLADRDRVSLRDLRAMPFMTPDSPGAPSNAAALVREAAALVKQIEAAPWLEQPTRYQALRPELEQLVHAYFGLTQEESLLVQETTRYVLPRIRPYGFSSAMKAAHERTTPALQHDYAEQLMQSLNHWRDTLGGQGAFAVETLTTRADRSGAFGLVRVTLQRTQNHSTSTSRGNGDALLNQVLDKLRAHRLLPATLDENLYLYPDTIIQIDDQILLVKPLTQRLWLRRRAIMDADRIVDHVQRYAMPSNSGPQRRDVA